MRKSIASRRSRARRGYTVFEYLYRDASNYRKNGAVLLDGIATAADVATIERVLDTDQAFVAEQVGLPSLRDMLAAEYGGLNDDDHACHEFVALRPATPEEKGRLKSRGSLRALVKRFADVREWDLWLASDGLPSCRALVELHKALTHR